MHPNDIAEFDRILAKDWPQQLVVTDQPESWSMLVEQIAELEELLVDLDCDRDVHANRSMDRIKALLEAKRRSLREIDVG
ncbi:MAG: hypothetical protein WD928_13255 [Gammaproteobacteria bacterium]